MNINPYLRISLYKITAIYMLLVGIFETNGWRKTAFEKLQWQVDYPYIHYYLPLLFIVIWAIVYLIERSFGLTMAAFRLRSRAGVAAWFDVLILLLMIPIAYASAFNPTKNSIEDTSLYSPFLIWFQIFTSLSAIQSLGTLGEYRFNRNQPIDPPQTGLPVVPSATVTPVAPSVTPPSVTPPVPSVKPTGTASVTPPAPSVTPPAPSVTSPAPSVTPPVPSVTPPLITPTYAVPEPGPKKKPSTKRVPSASIVTEEVVPASDETPTPAVTEVLPTAAVPTPTVDPLPTAEMEPEHPLVDSPAPVIDSQLGVWERIKRLFGMKPAAPTQLVMTEVISTENSAPDTTIPVASPATDIPPEEKNLIV